MSVITELVLGHQRHISRTSEIRYLEAKSAFPKENHLSISTSALSSASAFRMRAARKYPYRILTGLLSFVSSSTLTYELLNCCVRSENPAEDTDKHLLWFLALGRLQISRGERYSYMENT